MNGGQNNPGTVRITVTPNGSNPVQLSKYEVDNIARCDKLEMIELSASTGAVEARGVYYPNTAFTGEESVPQYARTFRRRNGHGRRVDD